MLTFILKKIVLTVKFESNDDDEKNNDEFNLTENIN